jgi:hypothetical protein
MYHCSGEVFALIPVRQALVTASSMHELRDIFGNDGDESKICVACLENIKGT